MTTSTARKPHQRYYLRSGDRVVGVTTVLDTISKPALYRWNNSLGLRGIDSIEHLDYLAGAGTLSHVMIGEQLGGPVADYAGYTPDQVSMAECALSGFHAWAEGKSLAAQELELALTSEVYHYGGTSDALLVVDGRPLLVDFKTSSRIYSDHCYQVAAYHHLLIETGYTVDGAMVLRLSRDEAGEYSERLIPASGLQPYFAVFLAALGLYDAIKQATKRGAR